MLKLNYRFKATSPIHHGSDTNLGIIKMLRKNKVFGAKRELLSKFGFNRDSQKVKYKAIVYMLLKLWDKMDKKDRYTIYEELTGKLLAAAYSRSKYEFLESLCAKLEVRSADMGANKQLSIVDIIDMFDDYELLETVRTGSIYIIAYFRQIKEAINAEKKLCEISETESELIQELFPYKNKPYELKFLENSYEYVPVISGNSIRGRSFVGTELNPLRLQKLLDLIAK